MISVVKDIIRGTPVSFSGSFYNKEGDLLNPTSATLYVHYRVNNAPITSNVVMTQVNTSVWEASWDSSGVDTGVIDWAIVANGDSKAVSEGSFQVRANKAVP